VNFVRQPLERRSVWRKVNLTNALDDDQFDAFVEQSKAGRPAARPGHQGLDGSDGLIRRDQAIERRLTDTEIPSHIPHVGSPKQSESFSDGALSAGAF
jgi:hypothetical protein